MSCLYELAVRLSMLYLLQQCTAHDETPEIFQDKVSQYQLMDTNVDSMYKQPLFYKHGVQFMKILVDEKVGNSRNIYVSSGKNLYVGCASFGILEVSLSATGIIL